jgi:hypothetical protein
MGGNRQKKSIFSVFSFFKPKRTQGARGDVYDSWQDQDSGRRVFPSDYDMSYGIVADRKVDTKADELIDRVRKSQAMACEVSHSEHQTVTIHTPLEKKPAMHVV